MIFGSVIYTLSYAGDTGLNKYCTQTNLFVFPNKNLQKLKKLIIYTWYF